MTAKESMKLAILQTGVDQLKEDFKEFKEETKEELNGIKIIVTEGNKKFDEIASELLSNESMGKVGFFKQVSLNTEGIGRNDIKLSKLDIRMIKIGTFMMIAGGFIGFLIRMVRE